MLGTHLIAEGFDLAVGAVGNGSIWLPVVFVRVYLNM